MEINLFIDAASPSEARREGGTWLECLNQECDGVVYLKIQGPEELILLPQPNPNL